MIGYDGKAQEIKSHNEKTGAYPLWSNAIFGGMPSYMVVGPYRTNILLSLNKIMASTRPISTFVFLMVAFYFLMIYLKVSPLISGLTAISFALSTYYIGTYEAGHISKINSIIYFPILLISMLQLIKKEYLKGAIVFSFGIALSFMNGHYQMIYYVFMCFAILAFMVLYEIVKSKDYKHLLKILGCLVAGGLLAIGANSSKLITTKEYAEESIRGQPILSPELTKTVSASNSTATGLSFDYAMQWSNNWKDALTVMVPGLVGGSDAEIIDEDYEMHRVMKQSGAREQGGKYKAPLYWGGLPSTSGPSYFGSIIIFLSVLGMLVFPGRLKWWIVSSIVVFTLLSLGKYLSWFQSIFFDFLPYYNRFRAPSSIMTITAFVVPILAGLGLNQILKKDKKSNFLRSVYISAGLTGGLSLALYLIGPSLLSFERASDANYQKEIVDLLISDRTRHMQSDALRSFLFILAAFGSILAMLKNKVKPIIAISIIALLSVIDIWSVGQRYLNKHNFVPQRTYDQIFAERPVDKEIKSLESNRGAYRVYEAAPRQFKSNTASYHHNTIGGYHPAKMQRMQDLIDFQLNRGNKQVLWMLNAKYTVESNGSLTTNQEALGNAWFVNQVIEATTPDQEMTSLNNLNPRTTAVVLTTEFPSYINNLNPDGRGTINMTNYDIDKIEYSSSTQSEQLAIFSEMWYGKNGWQAYIDNKPVDHIRANYALRALKIPAGNHTIRFEFIPTSFATGETISLISSILLLLGLVYLMFGQASWFPKILPKKLA